LTRSDQEHSERGIPIEGKLWPWDLNTAGNVLPDSSRALEEKKNSTGAYAKEGGKKGLIS